jgi:hypothetical protein
MWHSLIGMAMALGASPATLEVDVGRADWKALPPLRMAEMRLPTVEMVTKVESMLAEGQCRLEGQSARRFDITIPYAVLVQPDGNAHRVVVAESGCAELESYVGLVVLELARQGALQPTGEAKPRWYSSELNFNME